MTSDKKVFEIAKSSPKKSHSLCYFDGMIYSIGGTSDITERYDRIANNWEKLASAPDSFGPVSACVIDKDNLSNVTPGIVVASFKRKDLYFFDVACNKYSKISAPVSNNASKLLLRVDDNIYCLSKNKVYHSTLEMKNWTVKSSNIPDINWCSLGTPKIVNSDVYFILDDFSVFVFSTKNFSAKGVKLVKK